MKTRNTKKPGFGTTVYTCFLRRFGNFAGLFIVLMAMTTGSANAASILVNGDFELGNTGFTSEFTFTTNITPASTYVITEDPSLNHSSATSYGDHTSGSGLMMAVNGSTTPDDVVWEQTVAVDTNSAYEFSVFTSSWFSPGGLQLSINNVAVGSVFSTSSINGVWEQTLRSWSSGSAITATLQLINTASAFTGNDFALDDLTFVKTTVIPIPATVWLFGSSLLGLIGLSRQKFNALKVVP